MEIALKVLVATVTLPAVIVLVRASAWLAGAIWTDDAAWVTVFVGCLSAYGVGAILFMPR